MISQKLRSKSLLLIIALALANIIFLAVNAFQYNRENRQIRSASIQQSAHRTQAFAGHIGEKLQPVMDIADQLAAELTAGSIDSTGLLERLGEDVEKYDYIDGLFVAYEPYKFSPNSQYFAPLFINSVDGHELVFLEYDYTENPWYQKVVQDGAAWVEPYIGKKSGNVIIQYGVPIYDREHTPIGIVAINFSTAELSKIVSSSLPEGEEGFSFVLSREEVFIYHPIMTYVLEQKTLNDYIEGMGNFTAEENTQGIGKEERKWVEIITSSGRKDRVFYASVPLSGWTTGIYFLNEKDSEGYQEESRRLIKFVIGSFTLLALLLAILIQFYGVSELRYWVASVTISLAFLFGIYFIWHRALNTPPAHEDVEEILQIDNEAVLKQFIEQMNERAAQRKQEVVYVPTGVFIQHLQFINAYNVMLSGYIWQSYSLTDNTYRDGSPISQGFILAETEPNAEVLDIEEAYRKVVGDQEVVGWYFRVSVRQEFDYRHYPFDQQTIWLRMWHKDLERKVILTPDLNAYKLLTPAFLPGLEENFVLPNWDMKASYFNYRFNNYNTTFGILPEASTETCPELYFNIVVQREFLSPFVTNIIPLIVVSILIFTVLITIKKSGGELLGFSGFGVIEICGAFFFVVIIAQIEVRDALEVSDIIYVDYFYFILYFMLLAISINSIFFARTNALKLLDYRDNLLPKIAFWPLLLGIVFAVTQIVFY